MESSRARLAAAAFAVTGLSLGAYQVSQMPPPAVPDIVPVDELVSPAPPAPPPAPPPPPLDRTAPTAPAAVADGAWVDLGDGLSIADLVVGSGPVLADGQRARTQWALFQRDGTLLDGSHASGRPYTYVHGAHQVIAGWERGAAGLRVGGKRQMRIPAALGFGPNGRPNVPPNTDLILELQLDAVSDVRQAPARPPTVDLAAADTRASGLQVWDLAVGQGEAPVDGSRASLHYSLWLEDGTLVDSTLDRHTPITLPLSKDASRLRGWIEGVRDMRPGGRRLLRVPPDLGYGDHGRGGAIPADATLWVEIELVDVLPPT